MEEINELWNNAINGELKNKEIVKLENKEQTPINFDALKNLEKNISIGQLQAMARSEGATE